MGGGTLEDSADDGEKNRSKEIRLTIQKFQIIYD